MAPNTAKSLVPEELLQCDLPKETKLNFDKSYRTLWGTFLTPLRWKNILAFIIFHVAALVGILTFPYLEKKTTVIWAWSTGVASLFGITAGAHRLWTHRSYKATLPMQILLMICYTMAGQFSLFNWVRHHRVHHKFSDTDADPHNAKRGFFFSHLGWVMLDRHPEVVNQGGKIDCSDLLRDPVIRFQKKNYFLMNGLFFYVIPVIVPIFLWNETLYWSIMQAIVRSVIVLHVSASVNSVAHLFGTRPYNKDHQAVENWLIAFLTIGEGWHNYHHAFPWDYKVSELGNYETNFTKLVLDLFATIGWVYDRRTPSNESIAKYTQCHGDGTHPKWKLKEISENVDIVQTY